MDLPGHAGTAAGPGRGACSRRTAGAAEPAVGVPADPGPSTPSTITGIVRTKPCNRNPRSDSQPNRRYHCPDRAQAGPRRPDQRVPQSGLASAKRQASGYERVLAQHTSPSSSPHLSPGSPPSAPAPGCPRARPPRRAATPTCRHARAPSHLTSTGSRAAERRPVTRRTRFLGNRLKSRPGSGNALRSLPWLPRDPGASTGNKLRAPVTWPASWPGFPWARS
jgi:hypothetical protein